MHPITLTDVAHAVDHDRARDAAASRQAHLLVRTRRRLRLASALRRTADRVDPCGHPAAAC